MIENTELQGNQHFPEDRDAPEIHKSFFRRFYEKYKIPVDYLVFGMILVCTLVTVSFSIYIIAVKYF